MSKTKASEMLDALAALKVQRGVLDTLLEDCAFFCMPAHSNIHERKQEEDGDKERPSDSHGVYCAQTLASHLFSNTVALGQKWFGFRAEDEEQNKEADIKAWHSEAADRTQKELNESNFALQVHEALIQLVTFGTAVMFTDYLPASGPTFRTFKMVDCWIAEDQHGNVDTLYREFQYTAKQAVEKFGEENLSPSTAKLAKKADTALTRLQFVHCVRPRSGRDMKRKDAENMPWESYYIEVEAKKIVDEGGYDLFPYAVPRFTKVDGSAYGRSPAMAAIDDLRMLNRSGKDFIDAVEQETVPPIVLPPGDDPQDFDMRPGAVNPSNNTTGGEVKQLLPKVDLVPVEKFIERRENKISDMFFLNLFLALEAQKNMTATEVVERISEKIQGVAPVVSRLQSEFYSPVLKKVVNDLGTHRKLSDPPEGIGTDVFTSVEYTTRLDAKLADIETGQLVRSIEQSVFILKAEAEAPQIGFIIKVNDAIRQIFHNNRVDPDLLFSEQEAEEKREAAAQEAAAAQAAQVMADKIQPIDMQAAAEEGSPIEDAGNVEELGELTA